ncbi:MAG: hypothetical protein KJ970_03775 [Candidatus Eisenbacteria bacterium]|uniref:Small multidrug resistance protein n=1 Tax=Eiseniibacteriota bacterium TaxID=2212470 RepID=A0A948RT00_UNCEI|nr:hypothetical protein [Candidatus Eisenbacteria bacterium]MBU1949901.1 hypothetical protein [Candidatus Eisenbacteria bacterium]MBU2690021.1 hypothetical protein [Candidatus Eisenbacteria bacterium]
MSAIALLITALVLNASANILIKYAATHPSPAHPEWPAFLQIFLNWPFVIGVLCFGSNLLAYTLALRRLPLSLAYPAMVSLGYLLILVVSAFLFNERLGGVQYAGAVLMLAGLWLLVR